jgi:glycerol-3-phosphate cytidylyltransferase-like family protein
MLEDNASAFYRTSGVLKYIEGISITNLNRLNNVYGWESLIGYDTLIYQRPSHEPHIALIELAKDMGIRVILDYDDDLLNVPFHNNASITLKDQRANIKKAIYLADEVWVTTPSIKHVYKPYNKNIHIIPNAHNDYLFKVDDKKVVKRNNKLMAYRGGASHEADVYQNINDIVEMINENTDWTFRFQGSRFKHIEERCMDNMECTDPSTLMQFFKDYHNLNANIAFFPLLTNVFNFGKSNISLLEATYAGSAFLGNKELNEFKHSFVADISKGVYDTFKEVKDDFDLLEKMNSEAWDWIVSERLLSNVNKLRIDRLL